MTPVLCLWCEEPIEDDEPRQLVVAIEADQTASVRGHHAECAIRLAVGSLGHQRRACSCYGGTEEDPPGVPRRVAARAANIMFRVGEPQAMAFVAGWRDALEDRS